MGGRGDSGPKRGRMSDGGGTLCHVFNLYMYLSNKKAVKQIIVTIVLLPLTRE